MAQRKPGVAVVIDIESAETDILLQRRVVMNAGLKLIDAELCRRAKSAPDGCIEGHGLWVGNRQTDYEARPSNRALIDQLRLWCDDDPDQLAAQLAYWMEQVPERGIIGKIQKMPNADFIVSAASNTGQEHKGWGTARLGVYAGPPVAGKHWHVRPGEQPNVTESYSAGDDPDDEQDEPDGWGGSEWE